METLRSTDLAPYQGAWFQIDTVHTGTDIPPWFGSGSPTRGRAESASC
ncbi:hypothetical protein Caci_4067 [Catenulispora acidiphila DSM 44928]|uniref:Uncharacterized protein n=1 Tax=Catenulispora acidiphila (strain DSM 44928 / JCM 14897 / NBRC 102108 / NRRL B-24433 / ID139908) TaxID=479433 RepID=C7QG87_CATAD|nr:hypothetical protein [Catenulispora acidiphila]ACU72932.1 hypothetical protein Caci_4067 [Catenulispora acidiphila DSM 44928]